MSTLLLDREKKSNDHSTSIDEKISDTASEEEVQPLGIPIHNGTSGPGFGRFWQRTKLDLDSIATQPSVFDDPVTLEVYRPPPQFENTHRFDPLARWTWREEKVCIVSPRTIRKLKHLAM